MEYIKEDQILLYEELCSKDIDRDDSVTRATIRFRENIKLAHHVVKKFSDPLDPAVDKEDIIQSSYLGLWLACLRFDDNKGYEFSSYAVPMIKGTILRMLRESEILKTPRSFKDIRSALLRHGFSLPLNDQELDILIAEKVATKEQLLNYVEIDYVYLDAPLLDKSGVEATTYAEVIPCQYNVDIGMELDEDEIEQAIDKVLTYIKPLHRDLVEEWMYANLSGVRITNEALGKKYGLSQPSVSRLLNVSISIIKMHGDEIKEIFGY